VRLIEKEGKTTISFLQEKLLNPEQRAEMKTHWKSMLDKIEKEISGA
jgi:hypothetical protein